MSFSSFSFPTPTLYGPGAISELAARCKRLGMHRPLVVTDGGLVKTPTFQVLIDALGASGKDRDWFVYSGVHPNPVEQDVREAAQCYRDHGCDGVIALGGGSPLDVGKAARLLVKRPGFDFTKFYDEADWSG
ncbi:MAG: iron-containing alcohol dehydrogenase, partial [Verrucomicrobia bacterium]|nr:iron-containing alcohol dehydrogenase [Verrucomicrobiota bacterium]